MSTREIIEYYDSTENSSVRPDLLFALEELKCGKVAIDCGCGAGSDIAYLRSKDFTVHAFDVEEESIERCKKRFKSDDRVILSLDSFSSFTYPRASLIVADASLFFCHKNEFDNVWGNITQSLDTHGIFCGSFLGPKDTMASDDYDKEAFWTDILVLTESRVKEKLIGYEILKWTEHDMAGETSLGEPHHWHIFSVVAKKI
ncbi:MAG: SAM-dependent methyltransferase [Oleiphilaceae bacterium]|jgi:SAM-dependent methyltransferase